MKERVTSAVIMLSISLLCVFLSTVTRVLLFTVIGALCAYEFSKNVEKLEVRCTLWVLFTYLAVQSCLTLLHAGIVAYVACFIFCVFLSLLSGVIHNEVSGRGALFTLAALSYPCVLFGIVMVVSVSDSWLLTLLLACVSTWVCDAFALFGGKRFGKHKIAPLVSPNKTVEGCICGALSSVLAGAILYFAFRNSYDLSLPLFCAIALLSSTMGQIGDLAESLFKRMIGVKDFSNLIPGHGGMFDRADSLLFSIPTVFFCLQLAGI